MEYLDKNYAQFSSKRIVNVKPSKESDTEVIRTALENLHKRFQELELEKNTAADLLNRFKKMNEEQTSVTKTSVISKEEIEFVEKCCDDLVNHLANILAVTQDISLTNYKLPSHPTNDSPVTSSTKAKHYAKATESSLRHESAGKCFKCHCQITPFVPSGPGETFSLPAVIQTLLASLQKEHNPFCMLSKTEATLNNNIDLFEQYLKQLMGIIGKVMELLNMECLKLAGNNGRRDVTDESLIAKLTQRESLHQLTKQISELQIKVPNLKEKVRKTSFLSRNVESDGTTKLVSEEKQKLNKNKLSVTSSLPRKTVTTKCPKQRNDVKVPVKKAVNQQPFYSRKLICSRQPSFKFSSNFKITQNNSETLRYIKLLQRSLRQNGYRLKMTED